jgi:hypothetical protein
LRIGQRRNSLSTARRKPRLGNRTPSDRPAPPRRTTACHPLRRGGPFAFWDRFLAGKTEGGWKHLVSLPRQLIPLGRRGRLFCVFRVMRGIGSPQGPPEPPTAPATRRSARAAGRSASQGLAGTNTSRLLRLEWAKRRLDRLCPKRSIAATNLAHPVRQAARVAVSLNRPPPGGTNLFARWTRACRRSRRLRALGIAPRF